MSISFAKTYALCPKPDLKEKVIDAVEWVISHQKEDGRWNYSVDLKTGKEREQMDFHQGYVLESIYRLIKLFDAMPSGESWLEDRAVWLQAIKKGWYVLP